MFFSFKNIYKEKGNKNKGYKSPFTIEFINKGSEYEICEAQN